MKTARVFFLVMAVFLLPVCAHAAPLGFARISFLEGDVHMRTTDAGDWVPAAVNTPKELLEARENPTGLRQRRSR
jgi:hypothetical protein